MSYENMQLADIQFEQNNSHNHRVKSSIFLFCKNPVCEKNKICHLLYSLVVTIHT